MDASAAAERLARLTIRPSYQREDDGTITIRVHGLASEVRLNVDLDVALTVLAHGRYRWLATRLQGFSKAKPKQLFRRFVETGGGVKVQAERIVVHFEKRCHNPILREAALDRECPGIPWLQYRPVVFDYH
jgi:hypothetical protein